MAKFNLNQLLSDRSIKKKNEDVEIVYRNPENLIADEQNFYDMNTHRLQQSIEVFGILQPILIRRDEQGQDIIIAGHRRQMCALNLLRQGHEEFKRIPCIYTTENFSIDGENDILQQMALIQANNFRDKTDWEKMIETIQMEELIKKLKEKLELKGRTRTLLEDAIGVSGTQLARYHSIYSNLTESLLQCFKEENINVSTAYELSKLPEKWQQYAEEEMKVYGANIKLVEAVKLQMVREQQIEGQQSIADFERSMKEKAGTDSVPKKEPVEGQVSPKDDSEKVSESDDLGNAIDKLNKTLKKLKIEECCENAAETREVEENSHEDVNMIQEDEVQEPEENEVQEQEAEEEQDAAEKDIDRLIRITEETMKKNALWLKDYNKCFGPEAKQTLKQKVLCHALDDYMSKLKQEKEEAEWQQPELPPFKNNDQRKAWLTDYTKWRNMGTDKVSGAIYYQYEFPDGAKLVAETYGVFKSRYGYEADRVHYHLFGGTTGRLWNMHEKYNYWGNSITELVEFIKYIQKEYQK